MPLDSKLTQSQINTVQSELAAAQTQLTTAQSQLSTLQQQLAADIAANTPPPVTTPPTQGAHTCGFNVQGPEYMWNQFPGDPTFSILQGYGCTFIRQPTAWEKFQQVLMGPLEPNYLAALKASIASAASHGIGVIVDLHNYGRWTQQYATDVTTMLGRADQSPMIYDSPNNQSSGIIGSAAVPQAAFVDLWTKLATALHGTPGLIGYDLMNEPHDMGTSAIWPSAAQAAINAIRSVDKSTTIYIEGDMWANAQYFANYNTSFPLNDPANNSIYEGHCYFDGGSGNYNPVTVAGQKASIATVTAAISPFINWCKSKNVRGFIGEFAVPLDDPAWLPLMDSFLSQLKAANMTCTYWSFGHPNWQPSPAWAWKETWWPNYNASTGPLDHLLIRHDSTYVQEEQLATLKPYF